MTKTGTEKPTTAISITSRSIHVPAFHAASTPSGTATAMENRIVVSDSMAVGSSRWPIRVVTGRPVNSDVPRSPRSNCPDHSMNCTRIERSRPRLWRTFSICSRDAVSPARIAAGSPEMRSSRNTINATNPMTGRVERMRWRMNRGMSRGLPFSRKAGEG